MKKTLFSALILTCAACFSADRRPYLKQNPERVEQIAAFLPEKPTAQGAHISNRAAWGGLAATPDAAVVLKNAEAEMNRAIPDCPDALYLEFSTPGNGNRTRYEKPYFNRLRMLHLLAMGECLENKGRFMTRIAEVMEAICGERSWTMPAHDRDLKAFNGKEYNVDLGASHRAEVCAWVLAALKGKLPGETAAKMHEELERRIFEPVRKCCRAERREDCGAMFWFQGTGNWTAVCQSCVTRAALSVVEDRRDRAAFVEGAERSVKGFIDGFSDDGYCSEGLGYWNYGWGNFLTLALAVREATGGRVDFCSLEKARAIMKFGTGILVAGCRAAPIADGGGDLDNGVLQLGHLIWPDLPLTEPAATRRLGHCQFMRVSEGYLRFTLLDFGQWERVPAAPIADYPIRTAFPHAQFFVMRPGVSDMPFRLSVKAGHNDEFHNHNDVGTYAIFQGDRQLAGDPGGTEYTAKTFSKHRYEIKVINSYGHPVPVLNGALQMPGAKFAGKVLSTEFTKARDTVAFDLLGAYDPSAAKATSLVRTFTYDRVAQSVAIADRVAFAGTGTFSVPVVTAGTLRPTGTEGAYELRLPDDAEIASARVDVRVSGAKWRMDHERIDNPNRVSPNRYAIVLENPVSAAEVTVTYTKPPSMDSAESPCLTIFEDGAYKADIVVPEKLGGVEKFAAEELAYHFKKAFGKEPEIVGEDKFDASRHPFHIYLGSTKAATAAGLPVGKLADEEHVVKTVGNGLYLLGGDGDTIYDEVFLYNDKGDSWEVAMRGTLYAAYDFLENEMGVKWLWPGETGEVVPKRAMLRVGAIDRRAGEPLESRFFHGKKCKAKVGFTSDEAAEAFYQGQRRFLLRQRHGTRRRFHANHSFAQWWNNYGKEHPEYFNMLPNGKRMPQRMPQLCTMCVSEPGVWKRRVDEWRKWWAKASSGRHPPYPWVNCCDNDGTALCTCPRCRSWDGPDPRFEKSDYWNGSLANDFDKYIGKKLTGLGLSNGSRWTIPRDAMWSDEKAASVSDRYTRFYNEVAALAKQYCPEAKAVGYAYVNYIDPPLKTRVGPDTVIIFVPRSYFPYDDEESANFRRQWGGWHRMGAERMVLRPNYMLAGGNHPIDTARRITDDFAFAYTNGMFACQQDSITGAWSAQAMHLYTLSRMLRDPLRGYEKAREDMLAGFGGAADAVNRYFNMVEAHSAKWTSDSYREMGLKNITGNLHDVGGSFRNPNAILGDFFDEQFFKDCYALLDEGSRAAIGDDEVLARIEFLRKGLRDTELGRNCRIAQKASDADPADKAKKAAYDAAYKALVDYRASVEGDFVCDYAHHADWERMFVGWPHKVRSAKTPQSKKVWGE